MNILPPISRASEIAQRIAGTWIDDDLTPRPPLLEWIQAECRAGCFQAALMMAAKTEPEPLRVDLALVEKVEPHCILVRVPCRVADHEAASMFSADVLFALNPLTSLAQRV